MKEEVNRMEHVGSTQEHTESHAKSFTVSCVVDENPRLYVELILWTICVKRYLPQNRYHLILYHIGDCLQGVASWLETQGMEIRHVAAQVIEGSPHCNKIAPFFDAHETDYTIVCDTDLYFVRDPADLFSSDRVRTAPNNHCNPPATVFESILAQSGLGRSYRPGITLFRGQHGLRETHVNNISGGLIAVPNRRRAIFSSLWSKWAQWLVKNRALLGQWAVHVDQVAVALAMEELEEDVEFLPPQTNTILHLLEEINSVYAFHLSTGHIPQFPQRFNRDRTLNTTGCSEGVVEAGIRLNACINEAIRVISAIPSLRSHAEKFLNPNWNR